MPSPSLKTSIRRYTVGARLTQQQHQELLATAATAALAPSEWARQQLVRGLPSSYSPPPVGLQHILLILAELLAIRRLNETDLQRSTPGAPPLTESDIRQLIADIDMQKSMGAEALLNTLSTRTPLPFPKG